MLAQAAPWEILSHSADPRRLLLTSKVRISQTNITVHTNNKMLLHLIGHQGGNRATDFMILRAFSQRAEQDEKKPVQHKRTAVSALILF